MTNPSHPLTDQIPNGRERSAWSCEERNPKNCRNAYGCHCAEITALVHKRDEVCAQLAALDGDPRGYDAGFAGGVEAAAKVCDDVKSYHTIKATIFETTVGQTNVVDMVSPTSIAIRAIPTPPDPMSGLEARVRELELLAGELLSKHIRQLHLRSRSVDDDKVVMKARATLEGSKS